MEEERLHVAVLLGGDSAERDVSIDSGRAVAQALRDAGHAVVLIDPATSPDPIPPSTVESWGEVGHEPPDPSGTGRLEPGALLASVRAAGEKGARVVFVALHGGRGENGSVQAVLEMAGMPYTGSGVLASALCMDKDASKRLFREAGLPTPRWDLIDGRSPLLGDPGGLADRVEAAFGFPAVLKPNDQGSSVGISFLRGPEDVAPALAAARRYTESVLIEEYVKGREITVGILDGEALPVLEIVPEGGFYDYERKYTGGTSRYQVPAELDGALAREIQEASRRAFRALTCKDYGRVDLRLAPDGTASILEVNTLPGLTATSLVPKAAAAAGIEFPELIERIIHGAL